MSEHLDPNRLSGTDLTDALIYRLNVDTRTQSAVLTIGIDPRYHVEAAKLFEVGESDSGMVSLVFSHVRSVSFKGLVGKPSGLAPDEPPHEYEISSVKVSRLRFRGDGFQLEVGCQNGQTCELEFGELRVERSAEPPGEIHDYEDKRTEGDGDGNTAPGGSVSRG